MPAPAPGPNPRRAVSPPFCRVERRGADGKTRHFVVHTQSPRFVVEFESARTAAGKEAAVIRRVCVPNSWAGDYHRCARQLGDAAEFFSATDTPPG